MSLSINTNYSSLSVQRDLYRSNKVLGTTFKRLSTGLRINAAKDDAAGLSISTRMTADIRGYNQAIQNVNDGISIAQVAEGVMSNTTDSIQRIRELTIQAANDSYSSTDRAVLQKEVDQLVEQINKEASTTEFNGETFLDGSMTDTDKKISIGNGTSVSFSISQSIAASAVLSSTTDESLVNTTTNSDQTTPSATSLNNGGYVVTWTGDKSDGSGETAVYAQLHNVTGEKVGSEFVISSDSYSYGIFGQRYDASGATDGSEFQINTETDEDQTSTDVAYLSDDSSVVVWSSSEQDGSGLGIYGQRYDSSGSTAGTEFQINDTTSNDQSNPVITTLSGGGFVVSWQSSGAQDGDGIGVYGKIYDSSGNEVKSEFIINTTTSNDQSTPSITALTGGGFVATWQSSGAQDGDGIGTYGQIFTAAGVQDGTEFLINTTTAGDQSSPSISALTDGGFVATFTSADASSTGVYWKRYDSTGNETSEVRANTETSDDQLSASLVTLSDESFVVVWQSDGAQDGSGSGIYAQKYGSTGVASGSEFLVNSTTTNDQSSPTISLLSDGSDNYLVSWEDNTNNNIQGRIFNSGGTEVVSEFTLNSSTTNNQTAQSITSLSDGSGQLAIAYQDSNTNNIVGRVLNADGSEAVAEFTINSSGGTSISSENPSDNNLTDITATLLGAVPDNTNFQFTYDGTSYSMDGSGGTTQLLLAGSVALDTTSTLNNIVSAINNTVSGMSATVVNTGGDYTFTLSGLQTLSIDSLNIVFEDGGGVGNDSTFSLANILTTAAPAQTSPSVTTLDDGSGKFVVAWEDSDSSDILTRIFNADGSEAVAEFTANSTTANSQTVPSIVSIDDGSGQFVVTWQDDNNNNILARVFDSSGIEQVAEFTMNTTTANSQTSPFVTSLSDGSGQIVATWKDSTSGDIYARILNSDGSEAVAEFVLNQETSTTKSNPVLTSLSSGGFIAAWESDNQDGSGKGVFWRRFNSDQAANTTTSNAQSNSKVTQLTSGGYIVTWESTLQDGSGTGIYAQRFDSDGANVGSEFLVNTTVINNQSNPSIASASDGSFIMAWQSSDQDGSGGGIYAQRYDSSGNADGSEFVVNTTTSNDQLSPSVAIDSNKKSVITWETYGQDSSGNQYNSSVTTLTNGNFVSTWEASSRDGSGSGIFGRIYDEDGTAQGTTFQINTTTSNDQSNQYVTSLTDGGFIVVWESTDQDGSGTGTYAQRYDSSGTAQGSEFLINTSTSNDESAPEITSLTGGGFAAVWQASGAQDGDGIGVYGRVFDANGTETVGEFLVNTTITNDQSMPAITSLSGGGFIVTWQSSGAQDGSGIGLYGQRYDSSGNTVGSEFLINTETDSDQSNISITSLSSGNIMAVWQSAGQDGDGTGVYGKMFDTSGQALMKEFIINTETSNDQDSPIVTSLSEGGFVVAWQSSSQDGSGLGIYAKQYLTLNDISLTTQARAEQALDILDQSRDTVSDIKSNMGSFVNRMESISNNLMTASINTTQSRSRIMDVDTAQETTKLTTASIIQRAAVAILAQANQQPNMVLQLLG